MFSLNTFALTGYYDNNLIIIYGKAGSYKSSLGLSILNSSNKKCCYIDLEGNSRLSINANISIKNDIKNINTYINENDIVLVDYIQLVDYSIEDIIKLKDLAKNLNKTIILISCCASDKKLINEKYAELKEISDLMLLTDK